LRRLLIAVGIIIALSISRGAGAAQQSPAPPTGAGAAQENTAKPGTDQKQDEPAKPLTPEERKKADLLADTEKLYRLTQELKAEVAKSNKDTLSISVVKKAQEVERLAKSIKERSRTP